MATTSGWQANLCHGSKGHWPRYIYHITYMDIGPHYITQQWQHTMFSGMVIFSWFSEISQAVGATLKKKSVLIGLSNFFKNFMEIPQQCINDLLWDGFDWIALRPLSIRSERSELCYFSPILTHSGYLFKNCSVTFSLCWHGVTQGGLNAVFPSS